MIILGIDPGSITTGYAFLKAEKGKVDVLEYGVFHAKATLPVEDRLLQIVTELEARLDVYRPEALAMEGVFFAKNAKSALVLGHIRGAILVACRRRGMSFSEYPPKIVKQAVTGYGLAEKRQVMEMVKKLCRLPAVPKPDDAADAVALALCHARSATSLLFRGDQEECSTI